MFTANSDKDRTYYKTKCATSTKRLENYTEMKEYIVRIKHNLQGLQLVTYKVDSNGAE